MKGTFNLQLKSRLRNIFLLDLIYIYIFLNDAHNMFVVVLKGLNPGTSLHLSNCCVMCNMVGIKSHSIKGNITKPEQAETKHLQPYQE